LLSKIKCKQIPFTGFEVGASCEALREGVLVRVAVVTVVVEVVDGCKVSFVASKTSSSAVS
jgi:hypothetical protein